MSEVKFMPTVHPETNEPLEAYHVGDRWYLFSGGLGEYSVGDTAKLDKEIAKGLAETRSAVPCPKAQEERLGLSLDKVTAVYTEEGSVKEVA